MKVLLMVETGELRELLRRGFEKRGDTVVLGQNTGNDQSDWADTPSDLIVLDQRTRNEQLLKWCRRMQQRGRAIPVLAITQHAEEAVACANDTIVHPFSFAEFENHVTELFHDHENPPPMHIDSPSGTVALNLRTHALTLRDAKVPLTDKEFTLLAYLLRYANKVVTREELLEHAWDQTYQSTSNVVDVHIKNVRRKLEEAHTAAKIETVRGLGYRFVG